jgi:hypothetical protein
VTVLVSLATAPATRDQPNAVTGSVPRGDVRAAALLGDGASRLADRFELATWADVFKTLDAHGPEALLR